MKNQIYVSALLCILIGSLVSCSGGDPTAETHVMQIKSCSVRENNILSDNFSSPIGLYILTEDNKPYANESYKNSASLAHGKWVINTPVYITGKGLVYSYFPYALSDNTPEISVDMNQQVDVLYSKSPAIINVGTSALSLELSHALSQIVVSVENEEVESLSLSSPATASLNICTGIFSNSVTGKVSSLSKELLIVPHLCKESLVIRLKNGNEYTYAISNANFSPGERYTYDFKLNANREKLEINSVTVEEWVSGGNHSGYL